MRLVEKIRKLFTRTPIKEESVKEKVLSDLKIYDDVILIIDETKYEGWISDITKNNFTVCYDTETEPFKEIIFPYSRPYNRSVIEFNGKKLYLNKI